MKIFHLLKEAEEKLLEAGSQTPRLDAEVILCNLLNLERIKLHIYPENEVDDKVCLLFWGMIEKRTAHMPIQYIVHKQEFMGLDFYVDEGVLIPRGDTEILVEKALELLKPYDTTEDLKVADIGTGSGAISVSLAVFRKNLRVYAVDISSKALAIAKKNATIHEVEDKINFIEGDVLLPFMKEDYHQYFDMIVSNPPYISNDEMDSLPKEVRLFEPHLALAGGNDGLDFYKSIIGNGKELLKNRGWLVLEIGYNQGEAVTNIMKMNKYTDVEIIKDLQGLDRVVMGRNRE